MTQYLNTFLPFVAWFGTAVTLMAVFTFVYAKLTPHPEFRLIREGNVSSAVALAGTMLGYVLPLASVMVHGANLLDFIIWAVIAMAVQLLVYFALCRLFKDYSQHLAQDHLPVAILGASVSVVVGIVNAAAQFS